MTNDESERDIQERYIVVLEGESNIHIGNVYVDEKEAKRQGSNQVERHYDDFTLLERELVVNNND